MAYKLFSKVLFVGLGAIACTVATTELTAIAPLNSHTSSIGSVAAQSGGCLSVYTQLSNESLNTGGNYGLVNDTTPLSSAWSRLQSASDANFDGVKVTDSSNNIYVKYQESSSTTFQGKGFNTVGTISLSSGPDSVKKIRFTKP